MFLLMLIFPSGIPTIWAVSRLFETPRVSDSLVRGIKQMATESDAKYPESLCMDR